MKKYFWMLSLLLALSVCQFGYSQGFPNSGSPKAAQNYQYLAKVILRGRDLLFPDSIQGHFENYAAQFKAPDESSSVTCQITPRAGGYTKDMDCVGLFGTDFEWRKDELLKTFDQTKYKDAVWAYVALAEQDVVFEINLNLVMDGGKKILEKITVPEKFKNWHGSYDALESARLSFHQNGRGDWFRYLNRWDPSLPTILCRYWDLFEGFEFELMLKDPRKLTDTTIEEEFKVVMGFNETRPKASVSIQDAECQSSTP